MVKLPAELHVSPVEKSGGGASSPGPPPPAMSSPGVPSSGRSSSGMSPAAASSSLMLSNCGSSNGSGPKPACAECSNTRISWTPSGVRRETKPGTKKSWVQSSPTASSSTFSVSVSQESSSSPRFGSTIAPSDCISADSSSSASTLPSRFPSAAGRASRSAHPTPAPLRGASLPSAMCRSVRQRAMAHRTAASRLAPPPRTARRGGRQPARNHRSQRRRRQQAT